MPNPQSQKHHLPYPERKDHCDHGCFWFGQIDPCLRYPLRRRPETIHRIPLHLCPSVFGEDGSPDVEAIHGIPPAIAIEQRNTVKNARSTVGTASEIYDYLRLSLPKSGKSSVPIAISKSPGIPLRVWWNRSWGRIRVKRY